MVEKDLISRSALLKEIKLQKSYAGEMRQQSYRTGFIVSLSMLEGKIAEIPVVDAEPVRHGKWSKRRKIGDVWCCSECGFGQLVSASFMYKGGCIGHTDNRTRFCPNCGARMGAEVKP